MGELLSVVMCSRDDARFAVAEAAYAAALAWADYEIIRIADARSMSEGYNRGYLRARGDRILFSHDDVEFLSPDLAPKLAAHYEKFDVFGVLGTAKLIGPAWHFAGPPVNYGQFAMFNQHGLRVLIWSAPARSVGGIQAVDGMFIATTRAAVERLDGWDESYPGFHCYDIDFSLRAHLAGLRVGVACDLDILHRSDSRFDTPEWQAAATVFMQHHRALLPAKMPMMRWTNQLIHPDDRAHAVRLMHPPHFDT